MQHPDLWRLRDCARLGEQAAAEGMDHASYAYHRWARRHVEELLYEDMYAAGEPARFDPNQALTEARAVLAIVLHRITDTIAEDWVAPNHRASQRASMCQYHGGGLADLIFQTLQLTEPRNG